MTPITADRRTALIDAVKSYLTLCERRDLAAASKYLAADAALIFPGGRRHADLETMAADGARVYIRIQKHMDRFDAFIDEDGNEVVISLGTLEGEMKDGRRFDGVRYLDRFQFVNGMIALQEVWNDMAALGFVRPSEDTAG